MNRTRLVLLTLLLSMPALWLLGSTLAGAVGQSSPVPTFTVEGGRFQHKVDAEGILVAENATPIASPRSTNGPMKVAWLAEDGSEVAEGDVVIRFDPTEMEQERFSGVADRDKALSQVEGRNIEQSTTLDNLERDEQIADLQLDHSREFQTTDQEIYSRNEILESEIDEELATRRKDHASRARDLSAEQGEVELDLLGLQQRQAELRIEKADAGLRQLEIRAPHAGIFVLRRDRGEPPQVGAMTWPGRPIAEIPQLDTMKAQVYVLEADAGGVEEGIEAFVTLEAHPAEPFDAEVRRVAAVAKRRTRWSPVQYFDIDLELELTDPTKMKPGQRVRATLLVQDLADVITVPREAIFRDEETNPYVFRSSGGEFERVDVVLGPIALGSVVIESGLDQGDVIALEDPSRIVVAPAAGSSPAGPPTPTGRP
ncbi:MAG: HlyD family efflux transporter periplasmic adaptor subunit [Acidobacteria bacterium]|nr:HlyD family efflux transporter periplasmic adaptor subunit [Acidobacteriota bacterium]